MEKIIVATDFTGCADNATEFAAGIAKKAHADLVLFHAVSVPVVDPMAPTFYIQPVIQEQQAAAEKDLKATASSLKKHKYPDQTPLRVETVARAGETAIELNALFEEIQAKLGVICSKGEDLATRFAGSTTIDVADNCDFPLLVVPSIARYNGFKHIIYAAGLHEKDQETIHELCRFASIFNATVTVLHVNTSKSRDKDEHFNLLKKDVLSDLDYEKINFENIQQDDASAAIDLVAHLDAADLLAMLKVKRNFFADLFHKSLTKEKIFRSDIPVLIYH